MDMDLDILHFGFGFGFSSVNGYGYGFGFFANEFCHRKKITLWYPVSHTKLKFSVRKQIFFKYPVYLYGGIYLNIFIDAIYTNEN